MPGTVAGVVSVSTASFKVSGTATGDLAGYAVAPSGDQDGDGHGDILVAAPWTDGPAGEGVGRVSLLLASEMGF